MKFLFYGAVIFILGITLSPTYEGSITGPWRTPDNYKKEIEKPLVRAIPKERSHTFIAKDSLRIPIVLYHHIRPLEPSMNAIARGLSVTPKVFDQQLEYFEKNGYTTITLAQLTQALERKTSLPKKSIILTFDDGYEDNYTNAFPLLSKHHFVASFFIFTQAVGAPDYVTWDQVKEMQKSGVFEIGSHTLSHADLPHIPANKMHDEIFKSKKIIEEHLGIPVEFFCYPYGHYTADIIDEVKRAGYVGALTTHYGTIHAMELLFETSRVRLTNDDYGVRLQKKMELFFR